MMLNSRKAIYFILFLFLAQGYTQEINWITLEEVEEAQKTKPKKRFN